MCGFPKGADNATCLEELPNKISAVDRKVGRKAKAATQDLLVGACDVLIIEWREACHHLVEKHSKGPPVHRFAMAL